MTKGNVPEKRNFFDRYFSNENPHRTLVERTGDSSYILGRAPAQAKTSDYLWQIWTVEYIGNEKQITFVSDGEPRFRWIDRELLTNPTLPDDGSPAGIFLTNDTVDAGSPAGTLVGYLYPESKAIGQLSYVFEITADPDNKFDLDPNTNNRLVLTDTAVGSDDEYTVDVRVTDSQGRQFTETLTINVATIRLSNNTVDEDAIVGTKIADILAIEGTAPFVFTIVNDPDNKFQIVGDELLSNDTFDYDVATEHLVRIRATDNLAVQREEDFTISVAKDPTTVEENILSELEAVNAELDAQTVQNDTTNSELQDINTELDAQTIQNNSIISELQDIDSSVNDVKTTIQTINNTIQSLKKIIQSKLNKTNTNLNSIKTKLNDVNSELDTIRDNQTNGTQESVVYGPDANGAVATQPPVRVGGTDYSSASETRAFSVDGNGRLIPDVDTLESNVEDVETAVDTVNSSIQSLEAVNQAEFDEANSHLNDIEISNEAIRLLLLAFARNAGITDAETLRTAANIYGFDGADLRQLRTDNSGRLRTRLHDELGTEYSDTNRFPVQDILDENFQTAEKTSTSTASIVRVGASNMTRRKGIEIENTGAEPLYVGGSSVTISGANRGRSIQPAEKYTARASENVDVYIISQNNTPYVVTEGA